MKRGIAHFIETQDGRTKCCHSVLDLMKEDELFLQFSVHFTHFRVGRSLNFSDFKHYFGINLPAIALKSGSLRHFCQFKVMFYVFRLLIFS